MIKRLKDKEEIQKLIKLFPVTAILGARQCGKTTLAKQFEFGHYFDLENPRDLARLEQPQTALEDLTGLIVIDEIQRKPEIFPLIRYLVDNNSNQKFLILGSASNELIKQSSESLAGRIGYFYLSGFRISDIGSNNIKDLWMRGGFPKSFIADNIEVSNLWRDNYITTLLERDLPQLGINIPANTIRRFWIMLSHYHGQILNYAELGRSFGISDMTIRKYSEILTGTFMIRILQPWYVNIGKRLVKRPKIYIRDSGIFHSLMSIQQNEQLFSHQKLGASWEGFALEHVCRSLGKNEQEYFFWSTYSGAEVDLFWQNGGKNWAIEFKYSDAPKITKSMQSSIYDLNLSHLWIVYPGKQKYSISDNITAFPLGLINSDWRYEN